MMSFGPVVGFGRSQSFMLSADLKKVKSKKKKKKKKSTKPKFRILQKRIRATEGFFRVLTFYFSEFRL